MRFHTPKRWYAPKTRSVKCLCTEYKYSSIRYGHRMKWHQLRSLILCIYLVGSINWMSQIFHFIDFITVHFFLKKNSLCNKLVISDSNTDTCHIFPWYYIHFEWTYNWVILIDKILDISIAAEIAEKGTKNRADNFIAWLLKCLLLPHLKYHLHFWPEKEYSAEKDKKAIRGTEHLP